jgi:hypothetical protein
MKLLVAMSVLLLGYIQVSDWRNEKGHDESRHMASNDPIHIFWYRLVIYGLAGRVQTRRAAVLVLAKNTDCSSLWTL